MVKTYQNKHSFKQKVRVVLCDEECWREYDEAHWQSKIDSKTWEQENIVKERMEAEGRKRGYRESLDGFVGRKFDLYQTAIEEDENLENRNYQI